MTISCTACANAPVGDVGLDPDEAGDIDAGKGDSAFGIPDVACADAPVTAPATAFRHTSSKLTAALGDPRHRGVDLIASASAETQWIEGDASYGTFDKALEDEDVDIYACRADAWQLVGSVRTDDEGQFALALGGDDRLPLGLRDMFVSVRGDRTGAKFLALVDHGGAALAVTDVDGTLTSSEAAFGGTIILGLDVGIHDGAPAAFGALADRGYQPVYLTARSRAWTEVTRQWLATKGMPRGPLRLAPHTVLPGSATVDFKAGALTALTGYELALGNGNRASDIEAYQRAGIPADRIFVKLPEFTLELQPHLDAGEAVGYEHYDELRAIAEQLPPH
ncbi:MAG TPA: hypothetical protein VFQ53_28555 [Kofleriaceae bacterium]|nr:hypothetical protein [Kofleriaceae bacterium]